MHCCPPVRARVNQERISRGITLASEGSHGDSGGWKDTVAPKADVHQLSGVGRSAYTHLATTTNRPLNCTASSNIEWNFVWEFSFVSQTDGRPHLAFVGDNTRLKEGVL